MQAATTGHTQADSIRALHALEVLDSEPEAVFEALAHAAALACSAPIALVSLLDADRQWFKAAIGLCGVRETPRQYAFCAHAILGDGLFEVPDARLDARFASNPLVTGYPHIRFYAGAPICMASGERIGTLCVIDHEPRRLDETRRQILSKLATAVAAALEGRHAAHGMLKAQIAAARAATELALQQARAVRNLTAHRKLTADAQFLATHDALTGLINRAQFESQLYEVLQRVQNDSGDSTSNASNASNASSTSTSTSNSNSSSEHALLVIDLDDFKRVNDAGGHSVGDQALQDVAKVLSASVRTSDTVARLGGDCFAIILRRCPVAQAAKVAMKICARMDTVRFGHGPQRFRIGTSIGLVPIDKRWDTTVALLQAADSAGRAAKEGGGNRLHTWFDSDQAIHAQQSEMQWAARIEQALDEDRFVLFAQRITALDKASAGIHAEVLLRMVNHDGALVAPGLFLPSAERYRLAQRIDRWVLSKAIDWLANCAAPELVTTLSVNLSGNSVGDRAFHRWATDALTAAGAKLCAKLCLEITETATVAHMADATAFVQLVRAAGVRVALDDFGAGASSFGYLKVLPVDYLKIDGQFVRTLLTDPLDDVAVRCFVDVARVLGLKTVAEFVDHPAVLARLREIGVDFAQGFLLHRPAPLDELLGSLTPAPPPALSLTPNG